MTDNKEKNQILQKGRRLGGVVVSDKMQKTIVIKVDRVKMHSRYKKYYKISNRFKAHDEDNKYKVGDQVMIELSRPLSKEKKWRVV